MAADPERIEHNPIQARPIYTAFEIYQRAHEQRDAVRNIRYRKARISSEEVAEQLEQINAGLQVDVDFANSKTVELRDSSEIQLSMAVNSAVMGLLAAQEFPDAAKLKNFVRSVDRLEESRWLGHEVSGAGTAEDTAKGIDCVTGQIVELALANRLIADQDEFRAEVVEIIDRLQPDFEASGPPPQLDIVSLYDTAAT